MGTYMGTLRGVRSALRPHTNHPHPARFPLRGLRDLHLPHHTRSLRSRPRTRPRLPRRAREARVGRGWGVQALAPEGGALALAGLARQSLRDRGNSVPSTQVQNRWAP